MTGPKVSHVMVLSSGTAAISEGQIVVQSDTGRLYVDTDEGVRTQITDIVSVAAFPLAPLVGKLYVDYNASTATIHDVQGNWTWALNAATLPALSVADAGKPLGVVITGGSVATAGVLEDVLVGGTFTVAQTTPAYLYVAADDVYDMDGTYYNYDGDVAAINADPGNASWAVSSPIASIWRTSSGFCIVKDTNNYWWFMKFSGNVRVSMSIDFWGYEGDYLELGVPWNSQAALRVHTQYSTIDALANSDPGFRPPDGSTKWDDFMSFTLHSAETDATTVVGSTVSAAYGTFTTVVGSAATFTSATATTFRATSITNVTQISATRVIGTTVRGTTVTDGTRTLADYPVPAAATAGQVIMKVGAKWGVGTVDVPLPAATASDIGRPLGIVADGTSAKIGVLDAATIGGTISVGTASSSGGGVPSSLEITWAWSFEGAQTYTYTYDLKPDEYNGQPWWGDSATSTPNTMAFCVYYAGTDWYVCCGDFETAYASPPESFYASDQSGSGMLATWSIAWAGSGGGSSGPGTLIDNGTVTAQVIVGSTFTDGTRSLEDYPVASGGTNGQVMMIDNGTWGYGTVGVPANATFTSVRASTAAFDSSTVSGYTIANGSITAYSANLSLYFGMSGMFTLGSGGMALSDGTISASRYTMSGYETSMLGDISALGSPSTASLGCTIYGKPGVGLGASTWSTMPLAGSVFTLTTSTDLWGSTAYNLIDATMASAGMIGEPAYVNRYKVTPTTSAEATFALPNVSDDGKDHAIRVEVDCSTVTAVSFTAGTASIEPQKEITIESGDTWLFMCMYAGGAWKVWPIKA